MRALRLAAITVGLACGACVTYERGTLAAVSTVSLPVASEPVLAQPVEGWACGELMRRTFQVAVADALSKAPNANALINVRTGFERLCVVVRGTAVRIP